MDTTATARTSGGASPVLSVRGAGKTFSGNTVLADVDLDLAPGEIRALVGENGSGKSTFVKILAGYHLPDAGTEITVAGQLIAPHHPGQADAAGLRFVHQDLALVGSLDTVENLGLGDGYGVRRGFPVRWADRERRAVETMAGLRYDIDVRRPVDQLATSERTAVAVARAVANRDVDTRVLVLDEPTANLPGAEVDRLFALLRRVRERGIGILFVSHHLTEVAELADSVTVFRSGKLVTTRPAGEMTEELLIDLMVGHQVTREATTRVEPIGPVMLRADAVSGGSVRELSIEVRAGEIVGVAGITGSGRESLAQTIYGAIPRSGSVMVGGTEVRGGRPDLSIAAGMALVPADRVRNGILHGHDVAENLSASRSRDFVRYGVLRRGAELRETMRWLDRLDIRPRNPRMQLRWLSGGNAQKVMLARWLRLRPRVLLLDEPTQGVDVGAKESIHRQIQGAAADGAAVLICSTDNEELARICTRVVVLRRGVIGAELVPPFGPDDVTSASLTESIGRVS